MNRIERIAKNLVSDSKYNRFPLVINKQIWVNIWKRMSISDLKRNVEFAIRQDLERNKLDGFEFEVEANVQTPGERLPEKGSQSSGNWSAASTKYTVDVKVTVKVSPKLDDALEIRPGISY